MRNLTIKREKSFVASFAKMKVYIEDPAAGEITINHIPCRKIGVLKNGKEQTFQIGNQAAKVFVIADKLSKDYCNDFYQLPEGQEDIFLSGKNKYNPAGGNGFRFANNDTEEVKANRKKGSRKGLVVMLAALLVGAVAGYLIASSLLSGPKPKAKTFDSKGMQITLTDAFKEATSTHGFTVAYESKKVAVFALEESFAYFENGEDMSVKEYAQLVIENNDLDFSELKTSNGLVGCEHTYLNPESDKLYHYYTYFYQSEDAFWMLQFAVLDKNADKMESQIVKWAKSVEFDD